MKPITGEGRGTVTVPLFKSIPEGEETSPLQFSVITAQKGCASAEGGPSADGGLGYPQISITPSPVLPVREGQERGRG